MSATTPESPLRRGSLRLPRLAWHRSYTAGMLVVVLFLVYLNKSGGEFSTIEALGISNAALPLALVAVGETIVILTNGIDLSVGAIVTLSNVTVAGVTAHGHGTVGLVLALAIGMAAGLANGLIVCYLRIAPLIATLATSSIYIGFSLMILENPGGAVTAWLPDWTSGQQGPIPIAAIWLALLLVIGWVLLRRTPFGIDLQALGGSESAARSAGIHVTRVRILAYVSAGLCSALAGIALAGLTYSGDPTIGNVYLLDAIAAVVIGGTSLAGGVGTIPGTVFGALALTLLSQVLLVSGVSTNYQYIVSGAIVIGALLAHAMQARLVARNAKRARFAAEAAEG
jgi:ribose transport system permease protein